MYRRSEKSKRGEIFKNHNLWVVISIQLRACLILDELSKFL